MKKKDIGKTTRRACITIQLSSLFLDQIEIKGELPFQSFPGIFSSIDSYTKKMVKSWFDRHGKAPDWISDMGELMTWIDPPGSKRFFIDHEESGLTLSGSPDAFFVDERGKLIIVDFKTSKISSGQQKLMPLYELQLNAYALIARMKAEEFDLPEIGGLFLLYTEPVTDGEVLDDDENHGLDEFSMTFKSVTVKLELNEHRVHALLGRASEILSSESRPKGSRGCYECERVRKLTELDD